MPEYDFHTLSPMDFEILVRDLLNKRLGTRLKAFGHGPDGGVDLKSSANGISTIVQCKHYRGSSFSALKSASAKEKAKVDKLMPDNYYFVTSQDLSLTQQQAIVEELRPHLTGTDNIFAMLDINEMLANYPTVEKDHFKLWMASANVMQQIINSGIWRRNEALMEEIQDRVQLYVATPSFSKASNMLAEKGVCIITGAPGVGKSMLADMLALSQWQDGWKIIEIESSQINRSWDVFDDEERQFFYFDDVFGQTDVQERISNDNGKTVARLINYIGRKPKKQLVITTRTHILQEAELRDEPLARADLHARECVVAVDEYTRVHRARILYNHLYFSELPREVVRQFVNSYYHLRVIDHPNFTPRLIELTILQQDPAGSADDLLDLMTKALDHPVQLWEPSFREALSEPARRILLHLVTFPTHGAPSTALRDAAVGSATPLEFQRALTQLEGSWITIESISPRFGTHTSFHNPSCRDFILSFLDLQPDYVMTILHEAARSAQISQLLRYADATDRQRQIKYPNLKSVLVRRAAEVAEIVQDVWRTEPSADQSDAPAIIYSISMSSEKLGLGLEDWCLDQVFCLSERVESVHLLDGWNAGTLTDEIMSSGREPITSAEVESCKYLFLVWCQAVTEDDEWHAVFGFREWLEGIAEVIWDDDEEALLVDSFEQWLHAEADSCIANADSSELAREWIDHLKNIAYTYFGSLDVDFDRFEEEIRGRFYEEDFEPSWEDFREMRAVAAIESSETVVTLELDLEFETDPSDEKNADRESWSPGGPDVEIQALFDQLS